MLEQYRATEGQKAIGYQVEIAEDADLMNWEASLGEQPAKVQQAIEKILKKYPELNSLGNINAREFYFALAEVLGGTKEASLALRDAGIPGHSYVMDAYEYGKVKNFAIYDEQSIEITGKEYFQSGIGSEEARIPQTVEENIERGTAAMNEVIETHTDYLNAMYRPEVGGISFYWGMPGKGKKFKVAMAFLILLQHGDSTAKAMGKRLPKGNREKTKETEAAVSDSTRDIRQVLYPFKKDKKIQTWLFDWMGKHKESLMPPVKCTIHRRTQRTTRRPRSKKPLQILYQAGNIIHRNPQTQTQDSKMVGDSKVVDEKRATLVVYPARTSNAIGDLLGKTGQPRSDGIFTDNPELPSTMPGRGYVSNREDTTMKTGTRSK